jgi:CubicO group peptidase (beta-lactamase class C family)
LLKNESGLFDYYHSHLMVQFENNDELKGLPEHDRVRKEHTIGYENRDFNTVLGIINDKDLNFEPGKDARLSSTESVIMNEVLRRVTGLSTFDYLKKNVFDVLGMDSVQYGTATESLSYVEHNMTEHVSMPVDFDVEGIFSVKNKDLEKLMTALLEKQFLSETVWKTV